MINLISSASCLNCVSAININSASRLARKMDVSAVLWEDLFVQEYWRVLAIVQIKAFLSGTSNFKIFALLLGLKIRTVFKSHWPISYVKWQSKKQWIWLATWSSSHPYLQLAEMLPSVACNLSSVVRTSWTSFHKKEIMSLERKGSRSFSQVVTQLHSGFLRSTLHKTSSWRPTASVTH